LKQIKKENLPDKTLLKINDMIELDGKTKAEVYQIRSEYVNQKPEMVKALYNGEYKPSDEVFGQITDGKTWWGILGICYYGNGEKSIEGPSEESRFIANPYLLVGLCENFASRVNDHLLEPKAIYAEPCDLVWDLKNSTVRVTYNLTKYFSEAKRYHLYHYDDMYLVSYNARDLGFPYIYINPSETKNVNFTESKEPIAIPFFIHTGGSSGYPGGSNNMSPNFPPLDIKVTSLPAKISVKLWREKPQDIYVQPDLTYIIEME
jgi:hypothetical protein